MIRPHRCTNTARVFSALVVSLGLTFAAARAADNAKPATPTASRPAVDFSLTPNEYVKLGLPLPDQRWKAGDMVQAVDVLRTLAEKDPRKLPHYKSRNSGYVFARLTSPENLEPLYANRSAPISTRFNYAGTFYTSIGNLLDIYTDAAVVRSVSDTEIVELHGLHLRAIAVILDVAKERFGAIKKDDPAYRSEMANYDQLKTTMATSANTVVEELKDRWLKPSNRPRLVEYLNETLPKIVPQLTPEMQSRNILLLENLAQNPALKNLQPSLQSLRAKVVAAVEKNRRS